jgi:choline dehydrogenase-like flavoprotein
MKGGAGGETMKGNYIGVSGNVASVSIHPIGGCILGDDATTGVCNHKGQVFTGLGSTDVYSNMYICDSAVIPTALGVNPLWTISAVAERCVQIIAEDRGWVIDYSSRFQHLRRSASRSSAQHKEDAPSEW